MPLGCGPPVPQCTQRPSAGASRASCTSTQWIGERGRAWLVLGRLVAPLTIWVVTESCRKTEQPRVCRNRRAENHLRASMVLAQPCTGVIQATQDGAPTARCQKLPTRSDGPSACGIRLASEQGVLPGPGPSGMLLAADAAVGRIEADGQRAIMGKRRSPSAHRFGENLSVAPRLLRQPLAGAGDVEALAFIRSGAPAATRRVPGSSLPIRRH